MICNICGSELTYEGLGEGHSCPVCGNIIDVSEFNQPEQPVQQQSVQQPEPPVQQQSVQQPEPPVQPQQYQTESPLRHFSKSRILTTQEYTKPGAPGFQPQSEASGFQPQSVASGFQPQPSQGTPNYPNNAPAGNLTNGGAPVGKNSGGSRKGLIIGIISAIAVLCAALVVLLIIMNKKKDSGNEAASSEVTTQAAADVDNPVTEEAKTDETGGEITTEEATEETTVIADKNIWEDTSLYDMSFTIPQDYSKVTLKLVLDKDGKQLDKQLEYTAEDETKLSFSVIFNQSLSDLGIDTSDLTSVEHEGHTFYIYDEGSNYVAFAEEDSTLYVILYDPLLASDSSVDKLKEYLNTVTFSEDNPDIEYNYELPDILYDASAKKPPCGYGLQLKEDKQGEVLEKQVSLLYGNDPENYDSSLIIRMIKGTTIEKQVSDLTEYEIKTVGDNDFNAKILKDEYTMNAYYTQYGDDVYLIKDGGESSGWGAEPTEESVAIFNEVIKTFKFTTGSGTAAEIPELKYQVYTPENPILIENDDVKIEITEASFYPCESRQAYEFAYRWKYKVTNKSSQDINWMEINDIQINHFTFSSYEDLLFSADINALASGETAEGELGWLTGDDEYFTDGKDISLTLYYKLGEESKTEKINYYPHGEEVEQDDRPDFSNHNPILEQDNVRLYITKGEIGYTGVGTQITFNGYFFNDDPDKILIIEENDEETPALTSGEIRDISMSFKAAAHPECVSYFSFTIEIAGNEDYSADYEGGISAEVPFILKYVDMSTEYGDIHELTRGTFSFASGALD